MKIFSLNICMTVLFFLTKNLTAQNNHFLLDAMESKIQKKDSLAIIQYINNHLDTVKFAHKKDYGKSLKEISKIRIEYLKDDLICTDEELNQILVRIYKKLQKANPSISKNLNILNAHSLSKNASYLGFNTILVNNGILFHFDNEDQIAIVVAHEIAHHQLDHVNFKLREAINLKNDINLKKEIKTLAKSNDRPREQYEKLLNRLSNNFMNHSRISESQADSLAYIYASNAGYNPNEFVNTYQKLNTDNEGNSNDSTFEDANTIKSLVAKYLGKTALKHVDQPELLEKISILHSSLQTKNGAEAISEEVDVEDDDDDENVNTGSHPNLNQRINFFKEKAAKVNQTFEPSIQITDDLKEKIKLQQLSWLISDGNGDLGFALYNLLYLLEFELINDIILKESLVFTIQQIAIKAKERNMGQFVNLPSRRLESSFNKVLQILHAMNKNELITLAKETYEKYESDLKNGKNIQLLKQNHQKL